MKKIGLYLLGLAAVGGGYYLYRGQRRRSRGIEVSGPMGNHWFYTQDDGTLSRTDALTIANYCRSEWFTSWDLSRNSQVLTALGHPDLAVTCGYRT